MRLLLRILINAAALWAAVHFVSGIHFTGSTMGGGLGTGLFVFGAAFAVCACLLCDSVIRSTTVARLGFWSGRGMIPSVSRARMSAPLTASANASPDARRRSGERS